MASCLPHALFLAIATRPAAASFATSSLLRPAPPLRPRPATLAIAARYGSRQQPQPSPPPPPPTQSPPTWDNGLVFAPPPPPDSDCWDRTTFGGPVVTRDPFYQVKYSPYRLYYHGRNRNEWNMGVTPFDATLATGRIGVAMSDDGLVFDRFQGPLAGGALMDPSDDAQAFDCVHLEVSDVFFRAHDARWYVYYAGAGLDEHPLVGSNRRFKGVRPRAGLALSKDGIDIKDRKGIILDADPGSWDENGIFCPRVLPPWEHGYPPGPLKGKWIMSYHTRESSGTNGLGFFSCGIAHSDDGVEWEKKGKVLAPGAPGSWDEAGISSRYIIRHGELYLMLYEGSNYKSESAIGLAVSEDGIDWNKDTQCGPEPGGPVVKPRKGNFWDNLWVGDPYAIPMYDGSLRVYYTGVGMREGETTPHRGFGLALCTRTNFRTWGRYSLANPGPKENKRGFQPPKLDRW